jgi:hypothetical protein
MGDPNGSWDDLEWVAEKLWNEGVSLLPLDGNGKPLTDWRKSLSSDVSRLPLEDLLQSIKGGAEGLAIALGSSLNGHLWCRTFDQKLDYLKSVTLMGQNTVPMACAIREGEKTHVLFMSEGDMDLEDFEEIASGRFEIPDPSGTIKATLNLLRIPPGNGLSWIQEPVIDMTNPNRTNLFYYDPVLVGLLPPF